MDYMCVAFVSTTDPMEPIPMFRIHLLSLYFLAICSTLAGAACGGQADGSGSTGGSGSASFTVVSNRPTAGSATGASYSVGVSFTSSPPQCTTTTIGACTVNPCYRSATPTDPSVPLPSAGEVRFTPAGMMPFVVEPQNDGSYAAESVEGQPPWTAGGQQVTFQWAHFPGEAAQAGDDTTLGTPPYVALAKGSAFDTIASSLSRDRDLTIAWTTDGPPAATDELVVGVNSATIEVYCSFGAGAGTGVVPRAALGYLDAGPGYYNVHSKQYARESMTALDGTPWSLSFNVDATARTSYGLANGSVTLR